MWFAQPAAVEFLNTALLLPATGQEQDWEVELADKTRIAEFLDFHEGNNLSEPCRTALMALILSSFEEACHAGSFDETQWRRLSDIVRSNPKPYAPVLDIWTRRDSNDSFLISRHLAAIRD